MDPPPIRQDFDPQVHVPSPSYHRRYQHDHATRNCHVEGLPHNYQRSTCIDSSNLRTSHNSAFDEVPRGFEVYEDPPRTYQPSVVYETHHHHHSGGAVDSQILSLQCCNISHGEHFSLQKQVTQSRKVQRQLVKTWEHRVQTPLTLSKHFIHDGRPFGGREHANKSLVYSTQKVYRKTTE